MLVLHARVLSQQFDFGQTVAQPGIALLFRGACGVLGLPVLAEVAVFVGFPGEGGPRQFDQQHVVEAPEQGQTVGDQVVLAIDVGQQLVDPQAGGVIAVPSGVVEQRAQFVHAVQACIEFLARLFLRQRQQPCRELLQAWWIDTGGIGVEVVDEFIESSDRGRRQRHFGEARRRTQVVDETAPEVFERQGMGGGCGMRHAHGGTSLPAVSDGSLPRRAALRPVLARPLSGDAEMMRQCGGQGSDLRRTVQQGYALLTTPDALPGEKARPPMKAASLAPSLAAHVQWTMNRVASWGR